VDFEANDVGDLQGLLKNRTDVVEVGQDADGNPVALPAMDVVTVEAEGVVEAGGFGFGAGDELLE
jgi:hypothetical protein